VVVYGRTNVKIGPKRYHFDHQESWTELFLHFGFDVMVCSHWIRQNDTTCRTQIVDGGHPNQNSAVDTAHHDQAYQSYEIHTAVHLDCWIDHSFGRSCFVQSSA
jgi:hypothetical protein